jgi:hypothetical protein
MATRTIRRKEVRVIAKSWDKPFGAYLTGAPFRGTAVCATRLLNHVA